MGPPSARPPALKSCLQNSSVASQTGETSPLPFPRSLPSQHVHFPPTPTMSSFEMTYSSKLYDRAPIQVGNNVCAIPARGDRSLTPSASPIRGYFHPRSFEAWEGTHDSPDDLALQQCPSLIPDLTSTSSESEESDAAAIMISTGPFSATTPIPYRTSPEELSHALSFLPHPPQESPNGRKFPRRRAKTVCQQSSESSSSAFSSCSSDEWGCLGGF